MNNNHVQAAPVITSNLANYQAANYETETCEASVKADTVKAAQTASEELNALIELEKNVDALKAKVVQRKAALEQQVTTDKLNKLAELSKELGFGSLLEAATQEQSMNKVTSKYAMSGPVQLASKKSAPKVYKWLLIDPALETKETPLGYVRLKAEAKEQYRKASTDEIARMQAALDAWEAQHGSAKKA